MMGFQTFDHVDALRRIRREIRAIELSTRNPLLRLVRRRRLVRLLRLAGDIYAHQALAGAEHLPHIAHWREQCEARIATALQTLPNGYTMTYIIRVIHRDEMLMSDNGKSADKLVITTTKESKRALSWSDAASAKQACRDLEERGIAAEVLPVQEFLDGAR